MRKMARTRLKDFSERLRSRLMLGALASGSTMSRRFADTPSCAPSCHRRLPGSTRCRKWEFSDKPGFTMPFNVAGYTAISVCAGFGADGLPAAIRLVGKPFQEPNLLRVADVFDNATPFRGQQPALVAA